MNLLEGRLSSDQGHLRLGVGQHSWEVPGSLASSWQAHAGQSLTLGIRPNDLRLGMKLDPTEFTLPMQVGLVESLGTSSLVLMERDRLQLTMQLDGQALVTEKQTLDVVCDMNRIYLFDATGIALMNGRPAG